MGRHLVPASSNSKIRCAMENFTLDAERCLAALYWGVRTSCGDDAAHARRSVTHPALNKSELAQPRGKVIGGSTAINIPGNGV
jgi:choline dehydrogenase-like flavoprotein